MNSLYLNRSRVLATSVLVAGACSFLAAQTTTAVLLNATRTGFELEAVKGPDKTKKGVRASIEDFRGKTVRTIPAIQFRDQLKRDVLQFDKNQMLVLGGGDTRGETLKVAFKVTDRADRVEVEDEALTGSIEFTACTPAGGESKRAPFCSLALPAGSALADAFEIVPVLRKNVKIKTFEGKDYSFFELREKRTSGDMLDFEDFGEGDGSGEDSGEDKHAVTSSHGAGLTKPVPGSSIPAAPPLDAATEPAKAATGLSRFTSRLPRFGKKAAKPAPAKQAVAPAKQSGAPAKQAPALPPKPVLARPSMDAPVMPIQTALPTPPAAPAGPVGTGLTAHAKPEPVAVKAPGVNLWPAEAKGRLNAKDTPVVLHTLTFRPGQVAEGELFSGRAFVRTKDVKSGTALIGIRFDTADGKAYFGGRMDPKTPTESQSADRVAVGVAAKAPANVVKVTFSIQSRGFNPEAEATFDTVTFNRAAR